MCDHGHQSSYAAVIRFHSLVLFSSLTHPLLILEIWGEELVQLLWGNITGSQWTQANHSLGLYIYIYIYIAANSPSSETNICKTMSALIGFMSGGNPPMPKLERKVGEQ